MNLQRHMKPILYLVAVNLAIEIYSLIDVTMMNFLCGKDSIAFYKYGHNIQKMLLQVLNTFTIVLIPRISFYYKEHSFDKFNNLLSKALKLIIIVATPMIIGIFFTSDFLITKMYGDVYIVSAEILKLFSLLLLISPIGYLLGSRVLLVTGHENKMIISVGIGALVNIVGNRVLIPIYSEYGATIASITSEIVVMIVYVNMGKKYYSLSGVKSTVLKVVGSSVGISAFLWLCSIVLSEGWLCLTIQVIGAVFLYTLLLLLFKESVAREYSVIGIRWIKNNLYRNNM